MFASSTTVVCVYIYVCICERTYKSIFSRLKNILSMSILSKLVAPRISRGIFRCEIRILYIRGHCFYHLFRWFYLFQEILSIQIILSTQFSHITFPSLLSSLITVKIITTKNGFNKIPDFARLKTTCILSWWFFIICSINFKISLVLW